MKEKCWQCGRFPGTGKKCKYDTYNREWVTDQDKACENMEE